MIIRSQDKRGIVDFSNINIIWVDADSQWCYVVCFNGSPKTRTLLGTYSTEEKAIKVLDMIQEEYGKHYYGQGGQMATANYYVPPFAFIPPKVFQMPADEDVEV